MTYYNLHHTHHKRESFTRRMRDAFKAWRFKHSNRTSVRTAPSSHDRVSVANRTLVRTHVRDNLR